MLLLVNKNTINTPLRYDYKGITSQKSRIHHCLHYISQSIYIKTYRMQLSKFWLSHHFFNVNVFQKEEEIKKKLYKVVVLNGKWIW